MSTRIKLNVSGYNEIEDSPHPHSAWSSVQIASHSHNKAEITSHKENSFEFSG